MSRFGSDRVLTKWARLALGNDESAGKQCFGRIGQGSRWLRGTLIQAAHSAAHTKGTYWAALYRRLVGRLGVKRIALRTQAGPHRRQALLALEQVLPLQQDRQRGRTLRVTGSRGLRRDRRVVQPSPPAGPITPAGSAPPG